MKKHTRLIAPAIVGLMFLSVGSAGSQSIDTVKSCVVFIHSPADRGTRLGTGFLVGEWDTLIQRSWIYMVTAKHVVRDRKTNSFYRDLSIRMNLKSGGSREFPLRPDPLVKDGRVFYHPDPTVDLVVFGMAPNDSIFSYLPLPLGLIRQESELKQRGLTEGTDIFFPALFSGHEGQKQIQPVVRFGKIALITDERVSWGDQWQQLMLIESYSIGGNSGSPVFAWFEPLREAKALVTYEPRRARLIGVIQGAWGEEKRSDQVAATRDTVMADHTGISAIVPSRLIREIIYGSESQEYRAKMTRLWHNPAK